MVLKDEQRKAALCKCDGFLKVTFRKCLYQYYNTILIAHNSLGTQLSFGVSVIKICISSYVVKEIFTEM